MDASIIKDLPPSVQALIIVVLFWVANKMFNDRQKTSDKHDETLQQNTLALVELRTEVRSLKEVFYRVNTKVDNLESDVNALHRTKREKSNNS